MSDNLRFVLIPNNPNKSINFNRHFQQAIIIIIISFKLKNIIINMSKKKIDENMQD